MKPIIIIWLLFSFSVVLLMERGQDRILSKEKELQTHALYLSQHIADVLACKKWQSQEEWYKRFNQQTRFISDESPCKALE